MKILSAILVAFLAAGASAQSDAVSQAKSRFLAAQYKEASRILDEAIASNPRNADAFYYSGRVKLATHDLDGAVDALSKAVELNDRSAEYHVWLGRALGDQSRAANVFRQAILAGRSKSHFERAVELAPNDIDVRRGMAEFYAVAPEFLGGGKAKARAQAAEIKKLNEYEGYLEMAWVLNDGNDPSGAEKELLAAMKKFPDSAAVVHLLSNLYLQRLNRGEEGMKLELAYSQSYPEDVLGRFYLGKAAALSGLNLDAGERALKEYFRASPRHGEPTLAAAHFRLGSIYTRRGDKISARREFQTALQMDPSLTLAKSALNALGN